MAERRSARASSSSAPYDLTRPENWTVSKLREELNKNNISFRQSDKKSVLVKKVKELLSGSDNVSSEDRPVELSSGSSSSSNNQDGGTKNLETLLQSISTLTNTVTKLQEELRIVSNKVNSNPSTISTAAGNPVQLPAPERTQTADEGYTLQSALQSPSPWQSNEDSDGSFPSSCPTSGPSAETVPRIFEPHLDLKKHAELLVNASIEPSTAATYRAGLECFKKFLVMSRVCLALGKLPVINEDILVYFVTHCQLHLKLRHETIKTYLAGIRFFYLKEGQCLMFKDFERLHCVLRGVKKQQCNSISKRLPITFSILFQICNCLDKGVFSPWLDLMLCCMCKMAFFGFLRCGEFTTNFHKQKDYLTIHDVTLAEDCSFYTLKLNSSKTDPFRQGIDIKVFENSHLKPVKTMKKYLEGRLNVCHTQNNAALFVDDEGNPMSRNFFLLHVKQVLSRLGFDDTRYSGHSFRIGAATTAAAVGIQDHLIQSLGRWNSDCYARYIRINQNTIQSAQTKMCSS
ncbi:uncharacterized protein LOC133179480 [Saccostrea echinata]|uniref:uncharacterized protein LOC133179480 n=1 Tax=Saccostrea echinata TaxID=191078 RepID=UPI002A809C39|nr:uncharacterized protein LOC133179480 [Saccostrea echinata]